MSNAVQRRRGTTAQHAGFTGLVGEFTYDSTKKVVVTHDGATAGGNPMAPYILTLNNFAKANRAIVAFTATGAGTATLSQNIYVDVVGQPMSFASGATVVMPTLTAGTDYAIYACTDGTIRADSSFTNPSGYTTSNSIQIGGFHYAPGSNASAQAGGNTTPAINPYSFWDLKFKPKCPDPRGMTLVANSFWSDIYLLNVNHITNGTSKYNVAYARGTTPPLVPTAFGGNGSTAYAEFNWWEAAEVTAAYGKRLPRHQEFSALAYGTTEASAIGADQTNTILNAAYTSKWGVIQSTGVLDQWGNEFGGGAAASGWVNNTIGRGQTYQLPNAVLFGGNWSDGANAGSRSSLWGFSPTLSLTYIGARGVCDHLILV